MALERCLSTQSLPRIVCSRRHNAANSKPSSNQEDTEDARQDTLLRAYVFKTEMVSGQ